MPRCEHIRSLIDNAILTSDYVELEPLLFGTTITFTCPPGRALTGPNATTCMENGEWEPDPSNLVCEGTVTILCLPSYVLYSSIIVLFI